jgi:hypothetical protein
MKQFSKKGVLLFVGAMAMGAFVLPSVASAASWGPVGTHHTLDSPNIGFTSTTAAGQITSQCTRSAFTTRVLSAGHMEITAASFGGVCTTSGTSLGDCTVTTVPTRLPWTATAVASNNIQIHGVVIDTTFAEVPGLPGRCTGFIGQFTLTGTISGGTWTGNSAHAMDFHNAHGLVMHSGLGNGVPVTSRSSITDTQGFLTVF